MNIKELNGKKIVIYGAGYIARLAIILLRKYLANNFYDVVCGCAVSSESRVVCFVDGLPVKNIDEYIATYDGYLYVIAVKDKFHSEVEAELKKRNISNVIVFSPHDHINELEEMWKQTNVKRFEFFSKNIEKDSMTDDEYFTFLSKQLQSGDDLSFEINLADHCNLNCQSCNHFSPIADKIFINVEQLQNDLKRIKTLYRNNINRVLILGGEPLLHPKINKVLSTLRTCLPAARLSLLTNGILLYKMDKDFWELMRDLKIELDVTVYPVKFDYLKYEKFAQEYGIVSVFGKASLNGIQEPIKTTYLMPIRDNPEFNPYQMYAKCAHANYCVVLREGRIYNCSFAANVHYYNKYFNKHIPSGKDVSLDIYNSTKYEIDEFLKSPNKMCSHCDICGYIYDIPWAISKKQVQEWNGGCNSCT